MRRNNMESVHIKNPFGAAHPLIDDAIQRCAM